MSWAGPQFVLLGNDERNRFPVGAFSRGSSESRIRVEVPYQYCELERSTCQIPTGWSLLSRAHAEQRCCRDKNLCTGASEKFGRSRRSSLKCRSTKRSSRSNGGLTRCLSRGRGCRKLSCQAIMRRHM